ncbi:hypothetical protein TTHERM_000016197 (macronuclear) [Tetrahymena thermophila SB210]|uniref:Uncharacterized protein n=1 Tax=Tetrahymena thermophila (strain SB210) TaxID=312017 RepID=W7XF03_TETTS|nr:hypothetical protein TTHERM_000016197 [Tetrahymena thermophila SB210]EWS76372.1 hypothetical protein TTHERM_000016197 [Tetrahymena thermophila SB210]|eukprot:XP_012651156.1 hypothetical protein TTHERM_000016197 [Tetrahymena thermophila SB210]
MYFFFEFNKINTKFQFQKEIKCRAQGSYFRTERKLNFKFILNKQSILFMIQQVYEQRYISYQNISREIIIYYKYTKHLKLMDNKMPQLFLILKIFKLKDKDIKWLIKIRQLINLTMSKQASLQRSIYLSFVLSNSQIKRNDQ